MFARNVGISLLAITALTIALPSRAASIIDQVQDLAPASLAGVQPNFHPIQSFQRMANNISGGGFFFTQIRGSNPVTFEIGLWNLLPTDPAATRLAFGLAAVPDLDPFATNAQWIDAFWTPITGQANTTYYLSIDAIDSETSGTVGGVFRGNPYAAGELFLLDPGSGGAYLTYGSDTAFRTFTGGEGFADALAPTNIHLAQMAANAYLSSAGDRIGSFLRVPNGVTGTRDDNGQRIFAEAYVSAGSNGGRDQVVIAIRGTTGGVDHIYRNGTFLTGEAFSSFETSALDIANLVGRLHNTYPNADFTLTGHSLGGALAQAVGDALNVDAIGFDAPGANGALNANIKTLIGQLAKGNQANVVYSASDDLKNIRYYGDVVSLVGNPYGDVGTIIPSNVAVLAAIALANSQFPGVCILACHKIDRIVAELLLGTQPVEGVVDALTAFRATNFGIDGADIGRKIFNTEVSRGAFNFFDPPLLGNFVRLDLLDSDTFLESIYLPGIDTQFDIYTLNDGIWQLFGTTRGFAEFSVPISQSYLFSNARALEDDFGNFVVGLKFGSDGFFRGSLSSIQFGSAIPEPSTWLMLIVGFGMLGCRLRQLRNKRNGEKIGQAPDPNVKIPMKIQK